MLTVKGVWSLQGSGPLVGAYEQQRDGWGVKLPLLAVDRRVTSKQRGRTGHPSWKIRIAIKKKKKRNRERQRVSLPGWQYSVTFINLCASISQRSNITGPSILQKGSSACQLTSITAQQLRDCAVYFCVCVWHPLLIPSLNPLQRSMWWVLQSSDLAGLTDQGHAACVIAQSKQSPACFEQILLLVFLYDLFL